MRFSVAIVVCFVAVVPARLQAEEAQQPNKKFVSLYNGEDLTGWKVRGGKRSSWKADGELLSCVAPGGGWLRTETMYSDFVFRIEYRIPPGGNSGIALRMPKKGNPAHAGMEIQILDNEAEKYKNLKDAQLTGSIYYQAAAQRDATKPAGEWNRYEITCIGPHVKVVLNGKVVTDVQLDESTEGKGGHKPLADRSPIGYVGMQSHGSRVDFRHIAIRDVTHTTESGVKYADIKTGDGPQVSPGDTVKVHYTGRLTNGTKFDSSRDRNQPATFSLKNVIEGWSEGIPGMKVGGRRKLVIPPELGYGETGQGDPIPPGATLVFDVELLAIP